MIQALRGSNAGQNPPRPASTQEMVERIRLLVRRNAVRWKLLLVLEALGLTVAVPLGYLWLLFLADNQWHLPVWGRFLGSLGLVAAAAWLVRSLARRRRQMRFSEDQVALAIERHTPGGVQNRLINALQLARDPRHAGFGEAVVQENYERLQQIELRQAARLRPALVRVAVAAAVVAVGLCFWALRPAQFTNAASRILLPFANIDPLYRTVLVVEPGNVEGSGDVPIVVRIRGERPRELAILRNTKGTRSSETVPVDPDADEVAYTFRAVEQSLTYAVRGGDYTTPFYRIDVPTPAQLGLVRATYHYPAYTNLPDRTAESAGGDLEALQGTRADVRFVFDQPADEAVLIVQRVAARSASENSRTKAAPAPQRVALTQRGPTEFAGEIVFQDVSGYQLETRQGSRPVHLSGVYALRVLADQEPRLQLTGLERQTEAAVDAVLPVKATATDDYGLDKVGLFVRRVGQKKASPDEWTPVAVWPANRALEFHQDFDFNLTALGAVEGEKLEVALRAADTDPQKVGRWTTGTAYRLVVGGEGVALQLLYEQILQTEADLKGILDAQQQAVRKAADWARKFDNPPAGAKAGEPEGLAAAMKDQAGEQERLRQTAGRVARDMTEQAGNLRLSLGMLADTEMVRSVRILEGVSSRDNPQAKRAALGDARLTQERTTRSLQDILDHYVQFRQDWELSHLIPFTKLLADRQAGLRDESRKNAGLAVGKGAELRQNSMNRRQTKLLSLAQIAQRGFAGLADRQGLEPIFARAFGEASTSLGSAELKGPMQQAAEQAQAGKWAEAAKSQARAAELLAEVHARLRKAQSEAALQALKALQEKAKSDAEAQKEIEKLQAGTADTFLDLKDKLKVEEIIHMQEQTADKKAAPADRYVENYTFPESSKSILQAPDTGKRQQFDILKLAKRPSATPSFPNNSDRKGNKVSPHIQEKFDDLVGKLLEEADEIEKKYETYNLNAAFNINEPGDIAKQAGSLNSTAASAATGNMKPPTVNVGGASRSGRRGARAHGMVVGDESINRRGRDKVQEGQERVGDQAGSIREKNSDDPQKDTSTGVGGKKVETDDAKFSVADTGKFTEDIVDRMGKPQAKHSIVERQDGKLDPRVAEMMRDLNSREEQLIERIKTIRKELKNLYLPTDHLDEIAAELNANLNSLKDRPDAEVFRLQRQAIDRLRSTLRVFNQAYTGFQPSLPREQVIRGRVLDEPARQTLPGYEEAVKQYYQKLSER